MPCLAVSPEFELGLITMKRRVRLLLLWAALCVPNLAVFAGINEWTYVGLAPEVISDIEVNPADPDMIFVCAVDIFWDSTREGGLFRTLDHGLTWDTVGFRFTDVWDIAVDPVNPNIVWIADQFGAYRSTDFGDSWTLQSDGIYIGPPEDYGPRIITIYPYAREYLMCATDSDIGEGFYYRSTNGGSSWEEPEHIQLTSPERNVTYDAASPGVAYIIGDAWDFILFSSDTGRTFDSGGPLGPELLLDFKTAPAAPGSCWRATWEQGILRSDDYAQSWHSTGGHFMHTDTVIWSIDITGIGDSLVAATTYGVFLSFNGGGAITHLTQGYPLGHVSDYVKIVSMSPLEIWVYARDVGIWSYTITDSVSVGDSRPDTGLNMRRTYIYPNPTSAGFSIVNFPPSVGYRVEVFNLLGQQVTFMTHLSVADRLDVLLPRHLPNGLYFVRFSPGLTFAPITLKVTKQ